MSSSYLTIIPSLLLPWAECWLVREVNHRERQHRGTFAELTGYRLLRTEGQTFHWGSPFLLTSKRLQNLSWVGLCYSCAGDYLTHHKHCSRWWDWDDEIVLGLIWLWTDPQHPRESMEVSALAPRGLLYTPDMAGWWWWCLSTFLPSGRVALPWIHPHFHLSPSSCP